MSIIGTRYYGKVDCIEEVGHVATKFTHILLAPIVPQGSYFIPDDGEPVPVALSANSLLIAYAQTITVVVGFLSLVMLFGWNLIEHSLTEQQTTAYLIMGFLIGFASILGFFATKLECVTSASYKRASKLAEEADLEEASRIWIDLHYGKITDDQADQFLTGQATRKEDPNAISSSLQSAKYFEQSGSKPVAGPAG